MRKKSVQFALDKKGRKIVVINQILFYGKKKLTWNEVEKYLKRYIGKIIEVAETKELIHIASDFPDEYKGSKDTREVRGANAKAKANAVQGIVELIQISRKTSETPNHKDKNRKKAKYGWYRYLSRFALPIITQDNVIRYYNVYLATLVVRKTKSGKLYLYDIVNIKKEDSIEFNI
ncbi:MAG: hypothetical protein HFG29_07330 [Eubacterium sp.]|nr:hypothetical protein [Eubacterium sp.]